ncbi:hypothetical protein B1B_11315 [mine drainage metagenome]|uniref:GINS subunit domain-containing protein n=1 Tax=mine drainage metagenome TaxID=410659 RepID=T1B7P5_9ZZZZ
MSLTPIQVDKVCTDLQTAVRVEKGSKKVRKIEPDFYRSVLETLRTLRIEADGAVASDIEKYMKIKERIKQVETDFTVFFQLRFSKLMKLSLHKIDGEEWNQLTSEEKEFLEKQKQTIQDLVRRFTDTSEKEVTAPTVSAKEIEQQADLEGKKTAGEYLLLRITSDLPPISQPEGDYFLRNNDIVHLKEGFANMLIARKWAEKIQI